MTIQLLTTKKGSQISKYIYGQFSEHLGNGIYGGIFVGKDSRIPNVNGIRKDVVAALKELHVPVVRWPGGLFADTYHWRGGVGPNENRTKIVNVHWGDNTETNSFGTHEYFDFINQIGAAAYLNANIGSGSVREMTDWIEYMTMPGESPMSNLRRHNGRTDPWEIKFFGIGNEAWGGGGHMRPEYYSDLYRQYQSFLQQYDPEHPIYKVAVGPNGNEDDYQWTDTVMKLAGKYIDGLGLHYYAKNDTDGGTRPRGSATDFDESEWYRTMSQALYMDEVIARNIAIMDKYDPQKNVDLIVDEWGTWFDVEKGTNPGFLYQQNTLRDALVAAITLNIFHHHADRVYMANIAQMVNVLQAMLLTKGDQMIKTPTYYIFIMYRQHMGAEAVEGFGKVPNRVSYSASQKDGKLTISLANYDLQKEQTIDFRGMDDFTEIIDSTILTSYRMNDCNTFNDPDRVVLEKFTGSQLVDGQLQMTLPAKSVITVTIR
ncbi:MAG: alpha-N-arabinofuranosidase [Sporolactobacillus sp.]|nr:alpha-N-arabinofuranosidase [Sporolactobacillus sp.]